MQSVTVTDKRFPVTELRPPIPASMEQVRIDEQIRSELAGLSACTDQLRDLSAPKCTQPSRQRQSPEGTVTLARDAPNSPACR